MAESVPFLPLGFQPFGYPQAKNFVYAYAQQANFSVERDLGDGFALNLAYNFNGGRHLNRPINANTIRGDLLTANFEAAYYDAVLAGQAHSGQPVHGERMQSGRWSRWALSLRGRRAHEFLPPRRTQSLHRRRVQFEPRHGALRGAGGGRRWHAPRLQHELAIRRDQRRSLTPAAFPSATWMPTTRTAAPSITASPPICASASADHYEFLASYTWSHAIDDSTDLQSTLTPQDSYYPALDRSNSLFDQRHRFVFSGVYQTGKLGGSGFASKFFSDWTFAPIIEVASGRPFNIITGNGDNFSCRRSRAARTPPSTQPAAPSIRANTRPPEPFRSLASTASLPPQTLPTLLQLDGNLGRNAGIQPWTLFNDVRVAKRIHFGERFNMDLIADMFNIANRYNVAAVSPLFTNAGQATAAYDPRQFQFATEVELVSFCLSIGGSSGLHRLKESILWQPSLCAEAFRPKPEARRPGVTLFLHPSLALAGVRSPMSQPYTPTPADPCGPRSRSRGLRSRSRRTAFSTKAFSATSASSPTASLS